MVAHSVIVFHPSLVSREEVQFFFEESADGQVLASLQSGEVGIEISGDAPFTERFGDEG